MSRIFFIFLLMQGQQALCSETTSSSPSTASVKPQMHVALNNFIKILPYLSNELKFNDPKHHDLLLESIDKLKISFDSVNHMKAIKTPLFQPNSETINQQLKEARHQFAHQYKNMARIRVLNTLQLCVSCHTQLPPNQASSFSSGLKDFSKQNFSSIYEHATFLFIVRNYKESQLQFEKAIKDYLTEIKKMNEVKSKNLGSYNIKPLHDSFKKTLEILVKVNQNPTDATNFINKYIDTTELPAIIKSELSAWKNQLTKLSRQESLKPKNDLEVNRFINQTLNEFDQAGRPQVGYEMNLLLASGQLTRYLYQNPKTQKSQEILYWMGVISHRLNLNLFYDVGDLYLKQCMEKYKKNNYSKKCFDEFAEQIQFGYTGSSGTDIPTEISADLEKYRKLTH